MRRFAILLAATAAGVIFIPKASSQTQTEYHEYDELGRIEATRTTGLNAGDARSYCYDRLGNRKALRASNDNSSANCAAPTPMPTPAPEPTPTPTPPPTSSNNPPTANADNLPLDCFDSLTVNLTANDFDAEDYPAKPSLVSITRTAGPASASKISGSSSSVIVSAGGVNGTASFSYTITDSAGATDTGALTVYITGCDGTFPLE